MKKGKLITILSTLLLIMGLFSTLFFNEYLGGRILEVVTVATAVIGAVSLFFQFKRDKAINEASFIMEYWKNFSENDKFQNIMLKCDPKVSGKEYTFTKEDYFDIVRYAQWIEAISSMINRNVVSLSAVDDLYSYLFYIFVNNKYVQENELLPNKDYYQGTYKAYKVWSNYSKKHNNTIPGVENSLDKAWEENNIK